MEKFSTLPHQFENAGRLPHFPQHDKDREMDFLIFFTTHDLAVSTLLREKHQN